MIEKIETDGIPLAKLKEKHETHIIRNEKQFYEMASSVGFNSTVGSVFADDSKAFFYNQPLSSVYVFYHNPTGVKLNER